MASGSASSNGPDHTSLRHSLLGPSLLKAGQDQVDQRKVGEIIYNASKGSKFFKHEEKRDEQLTKRIEIILRRKKELEALDLTAELRKTDEQIATLEADRDLSQYIVHVDCDAFYASVEELDRPELKEVPMAVGSGVLTTCNYKAREFGVRSGMAGYIAKQLCPQLVFLPLSFDKYTKKAEEIREVLARYDERYEAGSCDEAFLNITGYMKEHPDMTPDEVTEQIRAEVFKKAKISISAGIAPNARLAKIASNQNKPNGQFVITPPLFTESQESQLIAHPQRILNTREAVVSFMTPLPVRKVNGVGRVFERELQAIGVHTWGDIYPLRGLLQRLFSEKLASFLLNCHLGLGRTRVQPVEEYERKSVGSERTFKDLEGGEKLKEKLRATAVELEKDLKRAGSAGRTVNLKVKLHSYEVLNRQRALTRPIHSADDLYNYSLPLLQALETEFKPLRLRLMGLRMTALVSTTKPTKMQEFFKNTVVTGKRKREDNEGEWEVWPEEEFQQMKAASGEKEEDILLLSQHDQLDEEEVEGEEGATAPEETTVHNARPSEEVPQQEEKWSCPICVRSLPADDALFNEHVDFCLSRETIKEAARGPSPDPEKVTQVQQRPRSQGSNKAGRPSDKRRKGSGKGKNTGNEETNTMRQYFVKTNE